MQGYRCAEGVMRHSEGCWRTAVERTLQGRREKDSLDKRRYRMLILLSFPGCVHLPGSEGKGPGDPDQGRRGICDRKGESGDRGLPLCVVLVLTLVSQRPRSSDKRPRQSTRNSTRSESKPKSAGKCTILLLVDATWC